MDCGPRSLCLHSHLNLTGTGRSTYLSGSRRVTTKIRRPTSENLSCVHLLPSTVNTKQAKRYICNAQNNPPNRRQDLTAPTQTRNDENKRAVLFLKRLKRMTDQVDQ